MAIKGLDIALAEHHGPGLGAAVVIAQEGRGRAFGLALADSDVDLGGLTTASARWAAGGGATAVVEVVDKIRGGTAGRRVVVAVAVVEVVGSAAAVCHGGRVVGGRR